MRYLLKLSLIFLLIFSFSINTKTVEEKSHLKSALMAEINGNYSAAIKHFRIALKRSHKVKNKIEILNNIAVLYYRIKKYSKAICTLKKCLSLSSKNEKIWNNLGLCYIKTNNTVKAIECFKKAINICKDFINPYKNLIALYYKNKFYNNALITSKKLISMAPFQPKVLYYLGLINQTLKKKELATFYFEASLTIKPHYLESLLELSYIYFEKKNRIKFINVAKRILNIQANDEILIAIAYTYYELKLYSNAIKYLQKAINVSPNNINALKILEMIYEELHLYKDAIIIRKKLIKLGLKNFNSIIKLGMYFHKLKKYDKALKTYKKLLKFNLKKELLIRNICLSYFGQKKYKIALKLINKVRNKKKLLFNIGWSYFRLNNYKKAENIYSSIAKRFPNNLRAKENLFLTLAYKGRIKDAENQLNKLRKKYDSPFISLYLAWICALKNNKDEAVKYFEEALFLNNSMDVIDINVDINQEKAYNFIKHLPKIKTLIKENFSPAQ